MSAIACGIKGPPQPPERKVLPVVADLRAEVRGSEVVLSWTPSLSFDDGSDLALSKAVIYRLDEELSDRLDEYLREQREHVLQRARAQGQEEPEFRDPPLGPLNLRASRIRQIPIRDFRGTARMVAELSVQQMIDSSAAGKVFWSEQLSAPASPLPSERSVYAVREVDAEDDWSDFSNTVSVISLAALPSPPAPQAEITQEGLVLTLGYPEIGQADDVGRGQLALVGFNVYKAGDAEPFGRAPLNTEPVGTAAPLRWETYEVISHQQLTAEGRSAYIFTTSEIPQPAGVRQTLIPAGRIEEFRGQEVNVEVRICALGGVSEGRIYLDQSLAPGREEDQRVGGEVFSFEENPLILIRSTEIGPEPQTIRMRVGVATNSQALVLHIEPRGDAPLAAPFALHSVSAKVAGSDDELCRNGDFSRFDDTQFRERIESFGGGFRYAASAIYSVGGFLIESEPGRPAAVELLDSFAPQPPEGLRALPGTDYVAVTWNASASPDVAGYQVWRREAEGQWDRVSGDLLEELLFRDTTARQGRTYSYRVVAVDRAGNASDPSEEVTVRITAR